MVRANGEMMSGITTKRTKIKGKKRLKKQTKATNRRKENKQNELQKGTGKALGSTTSLLALMSRPRPCRIWGARIDGERHITRQTMTIGHRTMELASTKRTNLGKAEDETKATLPVCPSALIFSYFSSALTSALICSCIKLIYFGSLFLK